MSLHDPTSHVRLCSEQISRLAYARSKRTDSPLPFASMEASKEPNGEVKKLKDTGI